nr:MULTISPECIES: SPASM domain-containing protein [unclassified Lentimicrobium]
MWRASVITWDGQVVPCCFDKDADHQMGNLLEDSFQNIKSNKKYTNFRNQVFSNRSTIEICKNCSEGL